jgi:peptide/nickel transport system permease protein
MRRPLRGGLGLGLVLLGAVTAMAVLAGVLAPIDPLRTGATPLQPPSRSHLLGTDELGRDLWSNIVYGARVSLLVGVLATLLATAAGVIVGMVAGYYGRGWDEGLMRAAEVFQIMPAMLIALLLVALFGGQLWTLVLVIAFTGWPMIARVVRSEILSLREREFVLAARALGGRDARIVWRHLLPNAFPPILINLPMQIGRAILLEAGLSFLGVGNSETSWGRLLQSAQEHMRDAWWLALFPGAALTVTVVGLYQVAEGLHAASIARVHRTGPVAMASEVFMEASPIEQGSRSPR